MSKKKTFSGSTTMTLKDFHGGSIPSDLPLPSAPGVSVRPPDRAGPWGPAAGGRTDHHRPRPGSAGGGGGRGFDERPPAFLLSHPGAAHIGRHFDEDEREPFDASSAPRRPADPVRPPPVAATAARSEPKRPISSPVMPQLSSSAGGPITGFSSAPNAWGLRKEVAAEPVPAAQTATVWSPLRIAQASAVEKVTSGRWQSKPPEVDVIRFQEPEVLDRRFPDSVRIVDDGDRGYERERARSVVYPEGRERVLPVFYSDGARGPERVRSPVYPEVKERNALGFSNEGVRPSSSEGMFGWSQLHQQGVADVSERPKLKLLPRTKPLEPGETWVSDDKQGYLSPVSPVPAENVPEMHGSMNPPKPSSPVFEAGSRVVERPKLSLKPRSLPVEHPHESAERARQTVFGGARPRELVLKERGIDVVAVEDRDMTVSSNRNGFPKADQKIESTSATRPGARVEHLQHGQRIGRDVERKDNRPDVERKDNRPDVEKVDVQRTSWRNDNRRSPREFEKPPEQARADLDTWRKPVEQPKHDTPGPRFGKAASPLELAQAFSRSVSDTRPENRFTSQRSLPGRTQVPFSRLTDTRELYAGPTQRQINGY